MLGVYWALLSRSADNWKAYGVVAIIYFLGTLDLAYHQKLFWELSDIGPEIDLVLSYVAIITTQAWEYFM